MRKHYYILLASCLLIACKGHQKVINDTPFEYRCLDVLDTQDEVVLPIEEVFSDTLLAEYYSKRSLVVANAFGLIPQVKEYEILYERGEALGNPDSILLRLMELEDDIDERLDFGMLELISVGNRVDCAILQLRKIKAEITEANLKSQNNLTNAAVIVGGAATILVAGILVAEDAGVEAGSAID